MTNLTFFFYLLQVFLCSFWLFLDKFICILVVTHRDLVVNLACSPCAGQITKVQGVMLEEMGLGDLLLKFRFVFFYSSVLY
jgi:hypothetical protein